MNNKKATPAKPKQPLIREYTVTEQSDLLPFLLDNVTGMGRNSVKSALSRGQIAVNGKIATTHNHPLKPGDKVSVSKERIPERPPLAGVTLLYEDKDILVITKESGLLSIASDKETQLTAYRQLMDHVRAADPASRIFVVHRLDRDTSGVMMFAKSEAVQQKLQEQWKELVKERTYIALVEGQLKKNEGTVSSWLKETKTLKMYSSPYPNDGQHAITHYKVLQSNRSYSLLEVELETGRKNQIRVHMQDLGHPVVGDKKYGARGRGIGRLGLHARVLAFIHPVSGKEMRFETPIPKLFSNVFRTV
ncbi:RluA family pseudouridine synthase [Paenibacillus gansuensis]|uniref:Pseudouridine synthase n=1 Tax=Paenibacillus gansuensis TaxID=306542 RepID=A0ABW5PCK8_9BACL